MHDYTRGNVGQSMVERAKGVHTRMNTYPIHRGPQEILTEVHSDYGDAILSIYVHPNYLKRGGYYVEVASNTENLSLYRRRHVPTWPEAKALHDSGVLFAKAVLRKKEPLLAHERRCWAWLDAARVADNYTHPYRWWGVYCTQVYERLDDAVLAAQLLGRNEPAGVFKWEAQYGDGLPGTEYEPTSGQYGEPTGVTLYRVATGASYYNALRYADEVCPASTE